MNAAIATNPLQTAPVGNIVIRPTQSTVVVGPTAASNVQPPVPVVDGRIIAASTSVANVPRPLVPANAAVAGTLLYKSCEDIYCCRPNDVKPYLPGSAKATAVYDAASNCLTSAFKQNKVLLLVLLLAFVYSLC